MNDSSDTLPAMARYNKKTAAFRFLPEADDVVLGLAGGGGQQVGDGLEDGADGLPPFQSAKGSGECFLCIICSRSAMFKQV